MKNMKTTSLVLLCFAALCSAFAEGPDPAVRRISREEFKNLSGSQRRDYLEKLFEINHGGLVNKAGTGKGAIRIVMSIKGFDSKLLNEKLTFIDKIMKWPVAITNGEAVTVSTAKAALKQYGANLGVFVIEADNVPNLLSAPEEGWTIVNVKALKAGGGTANTINKRITKEILRGLCLSTGCANIGGVMQPIRSQSELDLLSAYDFPLSARGYISQSISAFGVEPRIQKSYKVACQEGWAPMPTNEFQKAIWDKTHSIPTKPLKIEFDPKTDTK